MDYSNHNAKLKECFDGGVVNGSSYACNETGKGVGLTSLVVLMHVVG